MEFFEQLAVPERSANEIITQMVQTELLKPDIDLPRDLTEWRYLRISALGRYLLQVLTGKFCYYEAVMLETPFQDHALVDRIRSIYSEDGKKPTIQQRLDTVDMVFKQLIALEAPEHLRLSANALDPSGTSFMSSRLTLYAEDVYAINQRTRIHGKKAPPAGLA